MYVARYLQRATGVLVAPAEHAHEERDDEEDEEDEEQYLRDAGRS